MTASALDAAGVLRLVIFDCDGVLIDSEGPSNHLIAELAREAGLSMSGAEAEARFAGKALPQVQRELEAESGCDLGAGWVDDVQDRLVVLMRHAAEPIDGAGAMLAGLRDLGVPHRVGSNSSVDEMEAKFGRVGFVDHFPATRVHSARDMGRPKPDPHVYRHAASVEGVAPSQCVVIEDSDTGVAAAHDAGMACVLLRAAGPLPPHVWPGLRRIGHLDELVPLLRDVLRSQGR
ncbi:phosphatase [Neoasaia chiangmaiensis NBRC 101099]|uniref:Phosphatase n=1 Tax=Neoasaia chiangmaiensis TaxID=320497 RepID=A0A1U9KQK8_9PROT|nr:HAD family phosphatase [Neoasaia chiangmaiensis]AQS88020.1 phosphatase [Neoasaia chiangmaiensis]GBR38836.1 phosphatase [Neoasaia chiangmaiensis NBRC 101099]GEN15690.1 hydrolase [Neoasaia chiangmaiensis]